MASSLPLGRDSMTHRYVLEPASVVVGGPRALLMQVTHPVVGAGVADHSDYESDPWSRLIRTLQVMTQLALGSPERSEEMRRFLRRSHATINGVTADGEPYRALDVENMRWVWATLVDTMHYVADTFVQPLTADERRRLYEEQLLVAEACGVPIDACPADVDAFGAFVAETVERELTVTETARGVARLLQRPPVPFPLDRGAASVFAVLVPGQLPPTLRDQLGYRWTPRLQRRFDLLAATSRGTCRVVPGGVRRLPGVAALQVAQRLPAPT